MAKPVSSKRSRLAVLPPEGWPPYSWGNTGGDEAFPLLRYVGNHPQYAPLIRQRAEWVKDTIKYEVAQAERATGADVGRARST